MGAQMSRVELPVGYSAEELLCTLDANGDGMLEISEFVPAFYRLVDGGPFQQSCLVQMGINALKFGQRQCDERLQRMETLLMGHICGSRAARPAAASEASDRPELREQRARGVTPPSNPSMGAAVTEPPDAASPITGELRADARAESQSTIRALTVSDRVISPLLGLNLQLSQLGTRFPEFGAVKGDIGRQGGGYLTQFKKVESRTWSGLILPTADMAGAANRPADVASQGDGTGQEDALVSSWSNLAPCDCSERFSPLSL